jgi:hypothetical protein
VQKIPDEISANQLGMVMHGCIPTTQEAEAGGLRVPGLQSKILAQKYKQTKNSSIKFNNTENE